MDDFEIAQPTPEELRALFNDVKFPRAEIAKLLHVARKGLEKWTAPKGSASHRGIPLAAYELLLLKLGRHPACKPDNALDDFEITQPTPEEIKALVQEEGLSRIDAAALVHVSRRAWEKWVTKVDSQDHRVMPMAAWELLLIKTGKHPHFKYL